VATAPMGGNPYASSGAAHPPPVANNGLGIAGFILAIVGLFTCGMLNVISLPISLIALAWKPRGFAIAGTVVSAGGLAFLALLGWGFVAAMIGLQSVADEFGKTMQTHAAIAEARVAIERYRSEHNLLPDGIEGNKLVIEHEDAWGTALRYEVTGDTYLIRSAGSDQQFNTGDDITSEGQTVETNLEIDFGEGGFGEGPLIIPPEPAGDLPPLFPEGED
jgi:hypothetical protein